MAKIISTHSFRGGTGKTNTTANLAVLVAKAGHRVGVIDTDIQSPGIHVLFQLAESRVKYALNDYLWGKCPIEEAAYDVTAAAIGNVDPTTGAAAALSHPVEPQHRRDQPRAARRVRRGRLNDGFQQAVRELNLDYLFIDTHPGVNEETLLSIAISDMLLLVMRPDSQDFQGTAVTAELARRLEVPEMLLVVNKVPPGMDPVQLRERVEELYQAEVAALLPLNTKSSALASGGIFVNRFPDHPMTLALKQVAERDDVTSE